jgi:hypothetical protein
LAFWYPWRLVGPNVALDGQERKQRFLEKACKNF